MPPTLPQEVPLQGEVRIAVKDSASRAWPVEESVFKTNAFGSLNLKRRFSCDGIQHGERQVDVLDSDGQATASCQGTPRECLVKPITPVSDERAQVVVILSDAR